MSDAPAPADTPLAAEPTRVGRVLTLLRKLVGYGRELAATFQRHDSNSAPAAHTRSFGTSDIALILARITRGLALARALEDRLIHNAARLNAPPRSPRPPAEHTPRAAPPPAEQPAVQSKPGQADGLPMPAQIAAAVRRRPIGAVIADICRDFGISPSHPLWRELSEVIMQQGGNLARLIRDIIDRAFPLATAARARFKRGAGRQPPTALAATGPP